MDEIVLNLGRTGGPYLDIEEAKAREDKSAEIENREPDYSQENLFPVIGIPPAPEPEEVVLVEPEDDAEPPVPVTLPPVTPETESENDAISGRDRNNSTSSDSVSANPEVEDVFGDI